MAALSASSRRVLDQAGFATQRVTFSEAGTPDIGNLYARIGTGAPYLVFAGHTDVVPPGDASKWRFDPFAGELADGAVWGRGAADMKGGVAAFAAAACAYVARHGSNKGSIGFLITGDEEGPAINGTEKLLRWAYEKGERFDHCLVGEPTSRHALGDMIKIGRRGSLNGTLIVEGRQGHAAYPDAGRQPDSQARGVAECPHRRAARPGDGAFPAVKSRNRLGRYRQSGV